MTDRFPVSQFAVRAIHFVMMQKHAAALLLLVSFGLTGNSLALHGYVPRQSGHHRRAHRTHFRRLRWNPVFRPSHDSLLRQNEYINEADLPRIQNDEELEQLKASQDLLPIVSSTSLRVDPRLDPDRRYCRPWTLDFLNDLSEAYYKRFGQQIQVNSAVRTVVVQKKLRRHNRNAAPETGETASSHLAGVTVDIQRRGMTRQEVKWVEQYMVPLKDMGLIEPEEERHQWVFHVMVSDHYSDWRESKILAGAEQQEYEERAPELTTVAGASQR